MNKSVRYSKEHIVFIKDGEIRTAFDACEVCYGAKKGYTQEGEKARCDNCGRTFSIYDLGIKNKDEGGCWPGYLPNNVNGNEVIIKKSHLEDGSYLFK